MAWDRAFALSHTLIPKLPPEEVGREWVMSTPLRGAEVELGNWLGACPNRLVLGAPRSYGGCL